MGVDEVLFRFTKQQDNQICCECSAPKPTWAAVVSVPVDSDNEQAMVALVCYQCRSSHERLEHETRNLKIHRWLETDISSLEEGGNRVVNLIYQAKGNYFSVKPQSRSTAKERDEFCKQKYQDRAFFDISAYKRQVSRRGQLIPSVSKRDVFAKTTSQRDLFGKTSQHRPHPREWGHHPVEQESPRPPQRQRAARRSSMPSIAPPVAAAPPLSETPEGWTTFDSSLRGQKTTKEAFNPFASTETEAPSQQRHSALGRHISNSRSHEDFHPSLPKRSPSEDEEIFSLLSAQTKQQDQLRTSIHESSDRIRGRRRQSIGRASASAANGDLGQPLGKHSMGSEKHPSSHDSNDSRKSRQHRRPQDALRSSNHIKTSEPRRERRRQSLGYVQKVDEGGRLSPASTGVGSQSSERHLGSHEDSDSKKKKHPSRPRSRSQGRSNRGLPQPHASPEGSHASSHRSKKDHEHAAGRRSTRSGRRASLGGIAMGSPTKNRSRKSHAGEQPNSPHQSPRRRHRSRSEGRRKARQSTGSSRNMHGQQQQHEEPGFPLPFGDDGENPFAAAEQAPAANPVRAHRRSQRRSSLGYSAAAAAAAPEPRHSHGTVSHAKPERKASYDPGEPSHGQASQSIQRPRRAMRRTSMF